MNNSDYADKLQTLQNIAAKNLSHIKTFDKQYKTANHFVDILEKTFGSIEEAEKQLEKLPKKQRERLQSLLTVYDSSVLLIAEMDDSLADIKEMEEIQTV